jgi:superfamily II DNA or RNA helicase
LRATISSHIVLDRRTIAPALDAATRAALTIRNPLKERAVAEMIRGAEALPDEIPLYLENPTHLILPRGFIHRFEEVAQRYDEVIWDNQMTLYETPLRFCEWQPAELRGYQVEARDGLLDYASGIYKAPTGAGKTIVMLEVIRRAAQPTIIIVDKTALADQWHTEIRERYGYEAGLIGDGCWEERDVTVALRQSLWARRDELPADFWSHWGAVVVDEVHHASAETLVDLIQRFTAFYRFGCSATPEWDADLFPIVEAVVGPVVHYTDQTDASGVLHTPRIVVLSTNFEREYEPTALHGRRRIQNNYLEIMEDLIVDPERNRLIVNTATEEAFDGHHVLITTRRLHHVEKIVDELEPRLKAVNECRDPEDRVTYRVLTGKQSLLYEPIRQHIANATAGTILISTIAEEALDIPRLDRLVMAFPIRRVALIEQQIGRIRRQAPGKTDAVVYDIVDNLVGPIRSQLRDRVQQLYMRRRWPVNRYPASVPA